MRKEVYRSPPYKHTDGYIMYTIRYDDGKYTTKLEHREVMEKHLGRKLKSTEYVHHKDEDPTNNNIDNLEVMSAYEHSKHHHGDQEIVNLICVRCNKKFDRFARDEKHNRKKTKSGPYCTLSCSSKAYHENKRKKGVNK